MYFMINFENNRKCDGSNELFSLFLKIMKIKFTDLQQILYLFQNQLKGTVHMFILVIIRGATWVGLAPSNPNPTRSLGGVGLVI